MLLSVLHHRDVRKGIRQRSEQRRIVVDDDHDLLAGKRLLTHGLDGGTRLCPPLLRERGNHHGDHRRRAWGWTPPGSSIDLWRGARVGPDVFPGRARFTARAGQGFCSNGPENPHAIVHHMEIALSVNSLRLVTGDLLHAEPVLGGSDIHHGLYFEAATVEMEVGEAVRPKRVVAVAQVGVPGSEGEVHQAAQHPISKTTAQGDVVTAATVGEARTLGIVGARGQGAHIADDLGAGRGAVAVHHDDDVARAGFESRHQGVTLSDSRLVDDGDVRSTLPGDGDAVVHRVPIHQHHLVHPFRQRTEHDGQVEGLVLYGDYHADRRTNGQGLGHGPIPGARR